MPNLDLFLKTQAPDKWEDLTTEQRVSLKLKVDEVLSNPTLSYINNLPKESRIRALSSEIAKAGHRPNGYNQQSWSNLIEKAWDSIYGSNGEVNRIVNAFKEDAVDFDGAKRLLNEESIITDDEIQSLLDQLRSDSGVDWKQDYGTLLDVYSSYFGDTEIATEEIDTVKAIQVILQAFFDKKIDPRNMIRDTILVLGQTGISINASQSHSLLMSIETFGSVLRRLEVDPELRRPSIETVKAEIGDSFPVTEEILDALLSIGFWETSLDVIEEEQEEVLVDELSDV